MAGQVEQDVDAVAPHQGVQRVVVEGRDLAPGRHVAAQARAARILVRAGVIGKHLQARAPGQVGQHRLEEADHGMLAQVTRDEADPQPAFRIAAVGPGLPAAEPLQERRAEAAVLLAQRGRRDAVHLAHAEQHIAVRIVTRRIEA